jgi:hypothetical protein
MADEEKPKRKWTWWGEKKDKPLSGAALRKKQQEEARQKALDGIHRAQSQVKANRQMQPPPARRVNQNTEFEALLQSMTQHARDISPHNVMDAMCRENRGHQSASSARCIVCRPRTDGYYPYTKPYG